MVKLIIGGTGSGKTKELIDQVNAAVKEEKGSVVCISRGNKLTFDISHDARLIDAADYPVSDIASLLGFVGGLHAGTISPVSSSTVCTRSSAARTQPRLRSSSPLWTHSLPSTA